MPEPAQHLHATQRHLRLGMAAVACVLALGTAYFYFALFLPHAHAARAALQLNGHYLYGGDFHPIWLSSHKLFLHRANPYTPELSVENQIAIYGRAIGSRRSDDSIQGIYPYPLYTSFLIAPLAPLSFPAVQIVGTVLFPVLVLVSVFLWLQVLKLRLHNATLIGLLLLIFTSYPVLEGLYAQQLTVVVSALLAGTAAALAKEHLITAGVLLGLATVKPQLVLLLSLWLVVWAASDLSKRKAFIISLVGTVVALVIAGEIILPGWTLTWIRALHEYRQHNHPPLAQAVLGSTLGDVFSLALLAMTAAILWRARRVEAASPRFAVIFALMLAVSVPIFPSSIAVYDHLLLLPAILWLFSVRANIFSSGLPLRILGYASVAALFWQWIAGTVVAIASLLRPGIVSTPWVLLPVHTAASIPFAVVALCLWLWWKGATPAKSLAPSG